MERFFVGLFVGLSILAIVECNIFYESNPWLKVDKYLRDRTSSSAYQKNYDLARDYLSEQKRLSNKHNQRLIEALELFLSARDLTRVHPRCDSEEKRILKKLDEFLNHGFYKDEMARPKEIFETITLSYAKECNVQLNWKEYLDSHPKTTSSGSGSGSGSKSGIGAGALLIGAALIGR